MERSRGGRAREDFLRDYRKWVEEAEPKEMRLLEPTDEIGRVLAETKLSIDQRIAVSTNMDWIGPFYLATGAVRCFSEPPRGYRLLKLGLLFCYWGNRISHRARDFWRKPRRGQKKGFALVESFAEQSALGLVLAREEALWMLETMEKSLSDNALDWWEDDFFAAYMVRLYRKLKGEPDIRDIPPKAANWEHPFDKLIDAWDDDAQLAEAIREACHYHSIGNGEDLDEMEEFHRAEFGSPFAMVNPVEIHALEAVRSELGLSTPTVEHELLQPPFYPIPEFAKKIPTEEILEEDDLLRRIIERMRPWCDGEEE